MIVVTGTKRSGTSMWMQVLGAAGFPVIGDAFPSYWGEGMREANPQGFYESHLRRGIYYRTNPDPRTGAFLHPRATKEHVVKVFIPGVVRSDLAFLHRVLATMRHWRDYGPSLRRLYSLEDHHIETAPLEPGESPEQRAAALEAARRCRGTLPPAIDWFFETFDLIRDVSTRRYAFHLVPYERLLADPEAEIARALTWIGRGDLKAASAVVDARSAGRRAHEDEGIEPHFADFFDELYATVLARGSLSRSMVERMNTVRTEAEEAWRGQRREDAEG